MSDSGTSESWAVRKWALSTHSPPYLLEIAPRGGMRRIDFQCSLELFDSASEIAGLDEQNPEIVSQVGISGVESYKFPIILYGIYELSGGNGSAAEFDQRRCELVARLAVLGS